MIVFFDTAVTKLSCCLYQLVSWLLVDSNTTRKAEAFLSLILVILYSRASHERMTMIAMNTPRPVSTSRLNCLESKSVTEFSLIPTWDIIRAAKKINKPMITAIPISHFTNVNNFSGSSCLAIFFSKGINHFSFRFSNSAVVI